MSLLTKVGLPHRAGATSMVLGTAVSYRRHRWSCVCRCACIMRVRTHMGSPRPGPCPPWYCPRLYCLVAEGRVAANLAGVHAASNASQGRAFGLPTYPCVLAHAPRLGLLPA